MPEIYFKGGELRVGGGSGAPGGRHPSAPDPVARRRAGRERKMLAAGATLLLQGVRLARRNHAPAAGRRGVEKGWRRGGTRPWPPAAEIGPRGLFGGPAAPLADPRTPQQPPPPAQRAAVAAPPTPAGGGRCDGVA
jgi:hypothetical protein